MSRTNYIKGFPALNDDLFKVMTKAFKSHFTIQSDFSRFYAAEVGALASMGLISTQEAAGEFGRVWRVTGVGLETLLHYAKTGEYS